MPDPVDASGLADADAVRDEAADQHAEDAGDDRDGQRDVLLAGQDESGQATDDGTADDRPQDVKEPRHVAPPFGHVRFSVWDGPPYLYGTWAVPAATSTRVPYSSRPAQFRPAQYAHARDTGSVALAGENGRRGRRISYEAVSR